MNTYTFHITIYDLAFLGTIFIGLTFALQLWFSKRINQAANRLLALAVAVVVLRTAWVLGIDLRLTTYFPYWSLLPLQFSLAIGPLIFFYVIKITGPEYKFRWKDLLHFSPLLLEMGVFALEVKECIHPGAAAYDTLIFRQLNPVLQLLTIISVVTYLHLSRRLIRNFHWRLNANSIDRPQYPLRWLRRWLKRFALFWLLWIPFIAVDYFYYHNQLGIQAYYPLYLLLAVMMISITAAAFLRPEVGAPALVPLVSRTSATTDLRQKGKWLRNAMETGLFYQDPELSLRSLAETLDLHSNELSRIINTALGKSFNDFVNEYRIREVIRNMQDPAYNRITLIGIAMDAGFNSKSTFNRVFREMTGKSPAEYKSMLEKERPSYTLRPYSRSAAVISFQEATPVWSSEKLNRSYMFKNYLKIAWRNLMRNKSYAAINVTGLAIGIAACLLIFLIVQFETSFDNFHSKRNSVYRVLTATKGPDGFDLSSGIPFPTSEALRIDYPELKDVAAMLRKGGQYSIAGVNNGQPAKKFREDDAYYCEPQFFDIFDFGWLAGDRKTALSDPNTAVLTQDEADKFFGDWHNAIGKSIRLANKTDFKITGILKNFPDNTDFPTKIMMSYATLRQKNSDFWDNMSDWVSTYGSHNIFVVLPPGLSEAQFNKNLEVFVKKHKPADHVKDGMLLQRLSDMHYNTRISIYSHHPFSKELIKAISLIGIFLLLIACVNFINLATAQAVNRAKETGVRKVLGSNRKQLVFQFLSETFIITLFAVAIAALIAGGVMGPLNQLLQIKLTGAMFYHPLVLLFTGGAILCVTLLSGFYPAIVLSGFNPIMVLKNRIAEGKTSGISLRRALVILQFGIAQLLVIGTLVIVYQMSYFRNQSLGFEKNAVMNVPFPNDSASLLRLPTLRNQLMQLPGVKDVSYSFTSPSDNGGWSTDFRYDNSPKATSFEAYLKWADADYFNLYKLQFVAGGPYKKGDTITGYVVNETLLNKLGIRNPKDAIGKYIGLWDEKRMHAPIVGVVKDFNTSSLEKAIPPVILGSRKDVFQLINIKIQPAHFGNTLASVQKIWSHTFPDGIYEYQFLDDKIANFYKSEDQLSMLYKIFAGIAIFISCLGLYGLVSFMAVQRTKEVGIRKVLGASVGHIVYLFSKEFTLLIIMAFVISAPAGYYFMHKWLQDFAYKITIGPGIFILAILASMVIAWLTVGYKAVKAALANPVRSLRSE